HLLEHDVTLEERPLVAAIPLGPRHADPAALADPTAELTVEPTPRVRTPVRSLIAERLAEEFPHFGAQRRGLGRQLDEIEREARHGVRLFEIRADGPRSPPATRRISNNQSLTPRIAVRTRSRLRAGSGSLEKKVRKAVSTPASR